MCLIYGKSSKGEFQFSVQMSFSVQVSQSFSCSVLLILSPIFTLFFTIQYADPVADLLDRWGVFKARLFRESCIFHNGNYVKVTF